MPRLFPPRLYSVFVGVSCLLSLVLFPECLRASEHRILGVQASVTDDAISTTIRTADETAPPLQVKAFSLASPPRLVFNIANAVLAPEAPSWLTLGLGGIRRIHIAQFQRDPNIVRLVYALEKSEVPKWEQKRDEKTGDTILLFPRVHKETLKLPVIEEANEALLLRFLGIGQRPREVHALSAPSRVYLDIAGVRAEGEPVQAFSEGRVKEIRIADHIGEAGVPVSRLVIELREQESHLVFTEGDDLLVAVGDKPWALPMPPYEPTGRLKGKCIVVDPGHGGVDKGAAASPGPQSVPVPSFEKDITLDVGKRLTHLLEAEGATVAMTRSDDTKIGLHERADLANDLKADAFVSIHCNSCNKPDSLNGTMVFYDHENSVAFAQMVQEELIASLGTTDKKIRGADFSVIRRTQMPGILVEMAFINHAGDREKLQSPNFRERAARAIVRGLSRFLATHSNHEEPHT